MFRKLLNLLIIGLFLSCGVYGDELVAEITDAPDEFTEDFLRSNPLGSAGLFPDETLVYLENGGAGLSSTQTAEVFESIIDSKPDLVNKYPAIRNQFIKERYGVDANFNGEVDPEAFKRGIIKVGETLEVPIDSFPYGGIKPDSEVKLVGELIVFQSAKDGKTYTLNGIKVTDDGEIVADSINGGTISIVDPSDSTAVQQIALTPNGKIIVGDNGIVDLLEGEIRGQGSPGSAPLVKSPDGNLVEASLGVTISRISEDEIGIIGDSRIYRDSEVRELVGLVSGSNADIGAYIKSGGIELYGGSRYEDYVNKYSYENDGEGAFTIGETSCDGIENSCFVSSSGDFHPKGLYNLKIVDNSPSGMRNFNQVLNSAQGIDLSSELLLTYEYSLSEDLSSAGVESFSVMIKPTGFSVQGSGDRSVLQTATLAIDKINVEYDDQGEEEGRNVVERDIMVSGSQISVAIDREVQEDVRRLNGVVDYLETIRDEGLQVCDESGCALKRPEEVTALEFEKTIIPTLLDLGIKPEELVGVTLPQIDLPGSVENFPDGLPIPTSELEDASGSVGNFPGGLPIPNSELKDTPGSVENFPDGLPIPTSNSEVISGSVERLPGSLPPQVEYSFVSFADDLQPLTTLELEDYGGFEDVSAEIVSYTSDGKEVDYVKYELSNGKEVLLDSSGSCYTSKGFGVDCNSGDFLLEDGSTYSRNVGENSFNLPSLDGAEIAFKSKKSDIIGVEGSTRLLTSEDLPSIEFSKTIYAKSDEWKEGKKFERYDPVTDAVGVYEYVRDDGTKTGIYYDKEGKGYDYNCDNPNNECSYVLNGKRSSVLGKTSTSISEDRPAKLTIESAVKATQVPKPLPRPTQKSPVPLPKPRPSIPERGESKDPLTATPGDFPTGFILPETSSDSQTNKQTTSSLTIKDYESKLNLRNSPFVTKLEYYKSDGSLIKEGEDISGATKIIRRTFEIDASNEFETNEDGLVQIGVEETFKITKRDGGVILEKDKGCLFGDYMCGESETIVVSNDEVRTDGESQEVPLDQQGENQGGSNNEPAIEGENDGVSNEGNDLLDMRETDDLTNDGRSIYEFRDDRLAPFGSSKEFRGRNIFFLESDDDGDIFVVDGNSIKSINDFTNTEVDELRELLREAREEETDLPDSIFSPVSLER